ncbi:Lrp/AsnC family transcriptional regulator [archaeon]|jgi:DNA-binding Lrp family transcriptional regulator|nr:Lrp/AsnC family transcriptional regulator [archaeon]MBT6956466.1 Lrp/AsnC family transcriptional regulator [archaeon]MBT7128459.1 Lrp/AsnC family transcriptional regulator [archaeon]
MKCLENKNTKEIILDIKDKKILSVISQNARMPLTRVAKKVALSRDSINYRIKNYEKQRLIKGYRTIINIAHFGYDNYHLFIKLNNPSPELEKKIIDKLIQKPFIRAVLKFSGKFDLEIAIVANSILNLDKILDEINNSSEQNILDYELLAISKTFTTKSLPMNQSKHEKSNKTKIKKIDKKDIQILNLLSKNAKLPIFELAEKLKLSTDAIIYRIKKLKESGTIIKFIPVINFDALGYNLHVVLLNTNISKEKDEKNLSNFLSKNENTLWAVKAIGKFNVIIYLLTKNAGELQKTLLDLRKFLPGRLNKQELLIAHEQFKYDYFPEELIK